MPRLSDHERSGAFGMLKARVRVSDVAKYYYCNQSKLYSSSEIVTRLLGQLKMDAGLVN